MLLLLHLISLGRPGPNRSVEGPCEVHIAARALAQAADRQVVVTRTVRDLSTGTALAFGSLGSVSLRGLPGEWELFTVSVG